MTFSIQKRAKTKPKEHQPSKKMRWSVFRTDFERGFTLLEVVIVCSLMALAYVIAVPNFSVQKETDTMDKINRLAGDIRNAFDTAILNHKTYRLVFQLTTGNYWLEESNRDFVRLGDKKLETEFYGEMVKEKADELEAQFAKFKDIAGPGTKDPDTDEKIPATSPVLSAEEELKLPVWTKVENLEWSARSIGPDLAIKDMQAEHLLAPISIEESGNEAYGIIYFLPSGYVEKAFLHIYYRKDETTLDQDKKPFTLITDPFRGVAITTVGAEEVDVHKDTTQ